MSVDPKEKSEMARLITIMNKGVVFDDSPTPIDIMEGTMATEKSDSSLDPSVAAMKSILQAFHGTESPAGRLNERAESDRELREALVTEATERGTRIGSWEILINEDGQGLKSFDVTNVHTGEPIAADLTLYDAAHGIARLLNEGQTINSKSIRDILNCEANYDSSRQDAALFKARMDACAHTGNTSRGAIMEARYVESLQKAKVARVQLTKLTK